MHVLSVSLAVLLATPHMAHHVPATYTFWPSFVRPSRGLEACVLSRQACGSDRETLLQVCAGSRRRQLQTLLLHAVEL
jgi:hypothetical protein